MSTKQHFAMVLTVTLVAALERERRIWAVQRSRVWWQDILGTFTDEKWKEDVRMKRVTNDFLCTKFFDKLRSSVV